MHSTRQIFVCLLFFSLNGLFFFESNSVAARGVSQFKGFGDIVGDIIAAKHSALRAGLNLGYSSYVKSVRTVIESTSKFVKFPKPLTFFTALDEIVLANLTEKSFDMKFADSVTVASMTGGIFGNEFYVLYKYQLYWQKNSCNITHNLDGIVFYFNSKYGSFEEALDHPEDGVAVISIPVATTGDFPNPKFYEFAKILRKDFKAPGNWANVHSAYTFMWWASFPYGSIYHLSRQEFEDTETGKKYSATVIDLPFDPQTNYILKKQFSDTFAKIKGVEEHSRDSILLQGGADKSTERHIGVCVHNIPA